MTNGERFSVYIKEALRTAPPLSERDRKIVSALGLADEFIESLKLMFVAMDNGDDDIPTDQELDEAGDIAWYTAMLCDSFELQIGEFSPVNTEGSTIAFDSVSGIVGHVKKHIFHGHPLDKTRLETHVRNLLGSIDFAAKAGGSSLDDILTRNVAKLKARYPDGFSTERSINREPATT